MRTEELDAILVARATAGLVWEHNMSLMGI